MLVGTFITDSDGVESFIPESDTGFYLAKDAEIMVDVLDKKLSHLTATTIGVNKHIDEIENESKTD